MTIRADVIVLGAGMVGVSIALHLRQRGRDVVLVDRRGAGEETSYGNSGLIQREGVIPYTFPRELGTILSYAMNCRHDAVYHLSALPRIAPWLFRYWQNAAPKYIERSARALAPLMAQCVDEHEALIAEAGVAARALVRQNGWIRCLRTEASLREKIAEARRLDQYGIDYAVLTGAQLREFEPHVSEKIVGAIHFRGSPISSDPGLLTQAYADLFVRKGGRFLKGDARRLAQDASGWSFPADDGPVSAREAVVALGPWSDDVFRPLGYDIPLAVKRGYHMHYGVQGKRRARPSPARRRRRLRARADAQGHSPDDGRRIRRARRATNPDPARPRRTARPRIVSARGAAGGGALAGEASLPPRYGTGDRPRRAPPRPVVRLRPRASRLHARTSQRQAARRDDDRRDALYRSVALRCSPIFELSVADDHDRHPRFHLNKVGPTRLLGLLTDTWLHDVGRGDGPRALVNPTPASRRERPSSMPRCLS
jgi:glycine/D-amino acid oxidase-like deaminating enzyme